MFANFSAVSETPRAFLPVYMQVGLFLTGGRYFCSLTELFKDLSFLLASWVSISSLRCTPVFKEGCNFAEGNVGFQAPEYLLTDFCSEGLVPAGGGVLVATALERSDGGT